MPKYLNFVLILVVLAGGWLIYQNYNKPVPEIENKNIMAETKTDANPTVVLRTNFGEITLELFANKAPKTVENFLKLVNKGFYDRTLFHRVIKGFMIQGGDPLTKSQPANWMVHGTGDPGYKFADEFENNDTKLVRGVLAMANAGPDTNGSQFFIITAPATDWLEGKHTPFGKVTAGMEVVDKIENVAVNENAHPLEDVVVERVSVLLPTLQ